MPNPYLDGITFKGVDYDFHDAEAVRTVNDTAPDANGNVSINMVSLAENLYSDEAQESSGTFSARTSGGETSVADGDAWLTTVSGNMVHTGYSERSVTMTVNAVQTIPRVGTITATVNRATFIGVVSTDTTIVFSYTDDDGWNPDVTTYGITVTGTPVDGDGMTITYVKEVIDMEVNGSNIEATINRATWISQVDESGTTVFTYTTSWDTDPSTYGITVTGTPEDGDSIIVDYTKEVLQLDVNAVTDIPRENPITATIDEEDYDEAVEESGTTVFSYTNDWDTDPSDYGITVTGTPVDGDEITVVCVKESRGTITVFNPTSFCATGWNLYNDDVGYARVLHYEHGYILKSESFTSAKFSLTNDQYAVKTNLNLVSMGDNKYYFDIAQDGYVWLENADPETDYIIMTWNDWQDGVPSSEPFEEYTANIVDLSTIMQAYFPYGLMKVEDVADEINVTLQMAYSRIDRMTYTDEHLAEAESSGLDFVYDEDYIYIIKATEDEYSIELDGAYSVNDHGLEEFIGTNVPGHASMLYGQNLKEKLATDVLTISAQDLTTEQKIQARNNIKAGTQIYITTGDTTETVYAKLNALKTGEVATVWISSGNLSTITDGAVSGTLVGVVGKGNATSYRFTGILNTGKFVAFAQRNMSSLSYGTTEDITDGGYVHSEGDEVVNGMKWFKNNTTRFGCSTGSSRYHYLSFTHSCSVTDLTDYSINGYILMDAGNAAKQTLNRFAFYEYSPNTTANVENTGYGERYYLPAPSAGLTATKDYNIITTKNISDIPNFVGGDGTNTGSAGLVPATASATAVLRADGTWQAGIVYRGQIASGDDLNDYKNKYGIWRCTSATVASSLLNCPTTSAFSMVVIPGYTSTASRQIIYPYQSGAYFFMRTMYGSTVGSWFTYRQENADVFVHTSNDETVNGEKWFTGAYLRIGKSSNNRYHYLSFIHNTDSSTSSGYSTNAFIRVDSGGTTNQSINRMSFYEYSPNSTANASNTNYGERYSLPAPASGLTASKEYDILTTKNAVTLAQGGTGATSASGARDNLGIGGISSSVYLSTIANGTTASYTVANSSRGVLYVMGAANSICGSLVFAATSSGVLYYNTSGLGTDLAVAKTTRILRVANNNASATAYAFAILTSGSIST